VRLSLTILGTEVWSLHLCVGCACAGEDTEEATVIGGGYSHDFERDTTPLDPADHYGDWEDRAPRRFGFGGMA
jgi:hypothetical protein